MCLSEAKVTIKQDGQFIEAQDSISKYDYIPSLLQRYIRRFFMTFKIWPLVKKFIPKTIIGDWSAIEIDQNSMDINQIGNQVHLNFSRDWCIPNIGSDGKVNNGMIYPYVQSKYWNVGLFKYYQMKQLPNFLLAAPIIFLSCSAIYSFIKAQIRKTGANDVPKENNHFPFNSISSLFVLQLFIMLMTFPILHIQVMTRFLNSCPVLFWHFAHILQSTIIQRNERKIDNKSKKINEEEEKKKIRTRKIRLGLLLFYCIGYCIIGHIMFAMFQPWT
ncbi:MAG: putative glycosyltransferase family 76 protein [Streblomastix strix]|uniref:GPI mannosyltransferase 2 n=1 Tax=Streblomastix strix TaxID=222440 RepID=A0A5J4VL48_9EUKA|nr:MAG: putative glycosyltransferase family 76 protein [Streblomastix strix]